MEKFKIIVEPDSQELWASFGKNHKNFTSLLCELIDNSISNFLANKSLSKKEIEIKIEHLESHILEEESKVRVSIEDTGSGIKDFSQAMDLGKKNKKSDSFLNEHGFGLKNALATANKENDSWQLLSRTQKDYSEGMVNQVKAPWRMTFNKKEFTGKRKKMRWIGSFNQSGTYIEFTCARSVYDSISPRGKKFEYKTEFLVEEIGAIYRDFIEKNECKISLISIDNEQKTTYDIDPVFPEEAKLVKNESKSTSLKNDSYFKANNEKLKVEYKFYRYPSRDSCKERKKYYKRNIDSQGVEIRINGRLLSYTLFTEIWDKERNNSYNPFFGIINICGERKFLPATSTTKTGFIEDDPVYREILEKIADIFPKEFIPKYDDEEEEGRKKSKASSERKKQEKLIEKIKRWQDPKTIKSDYEVFGELSPHLKIGSLDIYLVNNEDKVILIENKKDTSKLLDIYQLRMYWDGYVYDKEKSPHEAYLISSSHPEWMEKIIKELNQQTDARGNKYHFVAKTWNEFEVD